MLLFIVNVRGFQTIVLQLRLFRAGTAFFSAFLGPRAACTVLGWVRAQAAARRGDSGERVKEAIFQVQVFPCIHLRFQGNAQDETV